ncbi:hypothetical protein OIU78_023306 [Salix suchowensis]|nr:hypothetical protein OIU78_023306 [Salix suchowensis]
MKTKAENSDEVLVQYVVLRRDLIDTWPMGSVVTQGCHASVSSIWSHKEDPHTLQYCSPENIDSMHKVTLEVKGEPQILNLSEKLKAGGIAHKLWIEQPENIPTCLATKPYPKSVAVCKRWLALITSSNFILAHCKHRPKHSIMLTNTWFGENYGISMLEADATAQILGRKLRGVTVSRSYLGPRISVVVQGIWYDLIFREEENIVQGTSREPRKVPSILRFDMANDVFSKIEDGLPYDNACGRNMNLMEYKELLAMGVYRDEVTTFELEIWTLMKNENCWTKLFLCRPLPKIMTMMPLGFLNDKEIILSDYSTELFYDILQLYDPSNQKSSVVSTCEEFIYFETHNYVESLVSVDAPGHQAVCRCFPDMERIKPSMLREQEKRKRKAGIDAFK